MQGGTQWRGLMAALAMLAGSVSTGTAEAPSAELYRIFLSNPVTLDSLVSYGEYARLGDRVVFSLPIGDLSAEPTLQLVTIPSDVVNWPATERYAQAARYAKYVVTRAEEDFGAMSTEVAETLNRIALSDDQGLRLRVAEDARRTLLEWSRTHFGYRADDIRQYVGLLDEIVSELRVATGGERFDLSLIAAVETPSEPLRPTPSFRETLEQALVVSRLTAVPAERISLLQSVMAAVDRSGAILPPDWSRDTRMRAEAMVAEETRRERQYSELAASILERADARARDADVRGVERVLRDVLDQDAEIGRHRPVTVTSLRVAVEHRLDEARALRLARDQWKLRRKAYARYEKATRGPLDRLADVEPLLDDIKSLAGPASEDLERLERRLSDSMAKLSTVAAPPGLQAIHGLLTSAYQFADSAVRKRRQAIATGDMRTAWDASSAAAAAVMLQVQAQEGLDQRLDMPELR